MKAFLTILVICSYCVGSSTLAEDIDTQLTQDVIERGKKEFIDTCSLCHGDDAKGGGPLAEYLTKQPPDLTQITLRNDGEFPFLTLYHAIDGQKMVAAHGSRKMPIWGNRFSRTHKFGRSSDSITDRDKTFAFGKIMELTIYLHSVQE